jgi:hypothetical protein
MVRSRASSVEEYLAQLSEERREVVSIVRDTIRGRLAPGFVETMNWGMICYEVPLARYPDTYNKQPLMYMALAAQEVLHSLPEAGEPPPGPDRGDRGKADGGRIPGCLSVVGPGKMIRARTADGRRGRPVRGGLDGRGPGPEGEPRPARPRSRTRLSGGPRSLDSIFGSSIFV